MRELPWDTRAVLSFCHPHGDGGRGDGDGPGQHQDVNRGWTIPGTLHWTSPEGRSHLQATWPQESRGPIRPPGAEGTGADASPREALLRTRSDSPAAAAAAWAEAAPSSRAPAGITPSLHYLAWESHLGLLACNVQKCQLYENQVYAS